MEDLFCHGQKNLSNICYFVFLSSLSTLSTTLSKSPLGYNWGYICSSRVRPHSVQVFVLGSNKSGRCVRQPFAKSSISSNNESPLGLFRSKSGFSTGPDFPAALRSSSCFFVTSRRFSPNSSILYSAPFFNRSASDKVLSFSNFACSSGVGV